MPVRLDVIVASRFALDGGAMFGVVPRPLWERRHPPDSAGRIRLASRALLMRFEETGRIAVIDAGLGGLWDAREKERLGIESEEDGLVRTLGALGVNPEDVTDAVITHLHFDHAGGWVRRDSAGRLRPVFPRAIHHVQREHWEWAMRPAARDRASFLARSILPLEEAGVLKLADGSGEILPGLEVRVSKGHTLAMQVPVFRGRSGTVAFPSDLLPTTAHAGEAWGMAYDLRPLDVAAEKAALFATASQEGWILVLEHDPSHEACTVAVSGEWFALSPCACPAEL
ncbi:MAG: MBL fold metallo-hydrolase [Deltaproteobacteria bacterium]|nr:MBL fold metallo-hydrolase [Deltaproteobacteria bacterium]